MPGRRFRPLDLAICFEPPPSTPPPNAEAAARIEVTLAGNIHDRSIRFLAAPIRLARLTSPARVARATWLPAALGSEASPSDFTAADRVSADASPPHRAPRDLRVRRRVTASPPRRRPPPPSRSAAVATTVASPPPSPHGASWDVDVESTPSPSESLPLIVGPAPWRASPASSRPGSQPSSALITPRWCDSWPPTPRRGWLSSTHSRLGSEPGGSMTPPPRSLAASGLVTPRQRAGRPSSPPPGSPPRIDDGDLRLPRVAPASAPSPPA